MEKVISMDDLLDPFCAPSPAIAGAERSAMNRCPSEWSLEKYLEEMTSREAYSRAVSNPRVLSIRDPKPGPSYNAAVSSVVLSLGREDEVAEIKRRPHDSVVARKELSTADPVERASFLRKKLYSSCAAAAAKLQGVGMISQDSSTAESRTDSSSLGSESPFKGDASLCIGARLRFSNW